MLRRNKKDGATTSSKQPRAPRAPKVYGTVGEFASEESLAHAAGQAYEYGYRKFDAYTPYPSEEVLDAMHAHNNRVPLVVLISGLTGLALGFLLQYYIMVIDYPLNFNGRAPFAWPAFVPAMFETTILLGAFGAVFGMLMLNGLPQLHHPIFDAPNFKKASKDGYFLSIEARDPKYDAQQVREFFTQNQARNVAEVNW